jgi:cytochrome c biogenesis protein CcdA
MNTFLYTLSLSLFDSFSTTQQIIIFILLLTTFHPIRNSMAYLAGLSSSYYLCGIGGYFMLDKLSVLINKYFSTQNMSDTHYYGFELFSGVVMTVIGIVYYRKKRVAPPTRSEHLLAARLKSMNTLFAFITGVVISVTSFPLAVPYLLALEKYATLHFNFVAANGYILLYNFGYALPMIVIFGIYLFAKRKSEDLTGTLQEKTRVLNVQLTTWALVGVGIFSMIDAGCYYSLGHALIKGRYF